MGSDSGRAPHESAEVDHSADPEGAVVVYLDESYEPTVAVAAVVVEATDALRFQTDLSSVFDKVRSRYYLGGMASFEEFRERGFHAVNDTYEVRAAFVAFLSEVLSFKSLIVYSDRSVRADLSDKRLQMVALDRLIRDLLAAYRTRPKVTLYFESAGTLDRYVARVVARVVRSFGPKAPTVEVRFGSKRDPELLAVPDYVLHIFGQWIAKQGAELAVDDASRHENRTFKAILGSVSMARSLDDDRVVRRTLA